MNREEQTDQEKIAALAEYGVISADQLKSGSGHADAATDRGAHQASVNLAGAEAFCRIRGDLSSLRKQVLHLLTALQVTLLGHPLFSAFLLT